MAKKKSLEDQFFPLTTIPRLNQPAKPAENPAAIKKIIQMAVQGAYGLRTPSKYDIQYSKLPKTLASEEQIEFVVHLVESMQPQDAIEAALASQFAISYIRGLKEAQETSILDALELFRFGHEVLEALTKFRTKGAQLINVQYNHNQGQIVNIKTIKDNDAPPTIEVC